MTIDLLDFRRGLDEGVLDPNIFLDEEIYQLELERIWRRSWVFVGHETMLARPGDYITTHLGEDPILLVSDPQGKPRAFLNRCRHKGVKLCPFDRGSAKNFSCVYHNWTYANDGSLVNVPEYDAGYRHLDKSRWGLIEVPRVASYGGFIFANWDAGAMSLDDYLGDFRYYLDNACGRLNAPGGIEMSPIKQRISTSHNWKVAAENISDMYHVAASHVGAMEVIDGIGPHFNFQMAESNYCTVIHDGKPELPTHTVLSARILKDPEAYDVEIAERFGQDAVDYVRERYARMRQIDPRVGNGAFIAAGAFPSMAIIDVGPLSLGASIELYHPKGPRETETWLYIFVEKEAPDAYKQFAAREALHLHSVTGSVVPSDHENWERMDVGLSTLTSRSVPLNYSFGLGGSHGPDAFHAANYGELPGKVEFAMSERGARSFYRHWAHMMLEA